MGSRQLYMSHFNTRCGVQRERREGGRWEGPGAYSRSHTLGVVSPTPSTSLGECCMPDARVSAINQLFARGVRDRFIANKKGTARKWERKKRIFRSWREAGAYSRSHTLGVVSPTPSTRPGECGVSAACASPSSPAGDCEPPPVLSCWMMNSVCVIANRFRGGG